MNPEGQGLSLPELVSPERWQRLQDHFADVFGIGLRTVSPSRRLLVNPSWPAGFDAEDLMGFFKLGEELDALLPEAELPQQITTISTPSGVSFSAVPLRAAPDQVGGYLVAGPVVLGRRESPEQLKTRAADRGVEPTLLSTMLLTLQIYSFSSMRSALRLMEDVGNTLLELAYQAHVRRASVAQPSDLLSGYADRLSQSLLETATAATQAEGGSVMLFDRQRQELRIQAAQGLPQEIVERTRLRSGEGIAGRALASRAWMLVDEQHADPSIKPLMSRPELVSSLVAPLLPDRGGEPIGVLNLRTHDSEKRFTQAHIELLRRLLNLAGIALSRLDVPATPPISQAETA